VEWEGQPVIVPSPEDILLMKAEKARRRGRFHLRDFNDVQFLLVTEKGRLDWDYLASVALDHRVGTALYVLAREAERQEGTTLVPVPVLKRLAPGTLEHLLIGGMLSRPSLHIAKKPNTARATKEGHAILHTPSKLWGPFWFLQHLGRRLGKPGELGRILRDRSRLDSYEAVAMNYLSSLAPKGLPPDLAAVLPIEIARTRWARLMGARSPFAEAVTGLEQAIARIDRQSAECQALRTPQTLAEKGKLLHAKLQTEFELGLNLLGELQSLGDQIRQLNERGVVAQRAIDILKKVASQDKNDPICWQARAWLGRCFQELGCLRKARRQYATVIGEPGLNAEPGKRLAKYFWLLLLAREQGRKRNALAKVQRAAEDWLETYLNDQDTPEGYGVRFQLAEAIHHQARMLTPAQPLSGRAEQLYAKAEKLYEDLERTKSDYADKARERRRAILLVRLGDVAPGDVERLSTFRDCYLQAQVEVARMAQGVQQNRHDAEVDPNKLERRRQAHLWSIITALTRALDLADENTPPVDRNEVRYMLAYAYLDCGEPDQAVALAEDLARAGFGSPRAHSAAALVLQAYAQIVARAKRDESVPALEVSRNRMCDLARYVEQTWLEKPVADLARHILGAVALQDKKYVEAQAVLAQVRDNYSVFLLSQLQLAIAGRLGGKGNLITPEAQLRYTERGTGALAELATQLLRQQQFVSLPFQRLWYETCFLDYFPELPDHAEPTLADVYLCACLERANVLFKGKKYDELGMVSTQIHDLLAKVKPHMTEKAREHLERGLSVLPLYVQYGQMNEALQAGRCAEVRRLISPLVSRLKKRTFSLREDPGLIRGILGLGLRASLEEGDANWSEEIDQLRRKRVSSDQENGSEACAGFVQVLNAAAGARPPST
jgi:tetratricopeptide (TPR) repeat protein